MSESQNSPPPQLGTNSSSVAIAILVPFFALIFTGFGFYLYKQRYVLMNPARLMWSFRTGKQLFFFFMIVIHKVKSLSWHLPDSWTVPVSLAWLCWEWSHCLLQTVPWNTSVSEVANWIFSEICLKHSWLVFALLTDANGVCSAANMSRSPRRIRFGFADWNLTGLPKKHNNSF